MPQSLLHKGVPKKLLFTTTTWHLQVRETPQDEMVKALALYFTLGGS